MALNTNGSPPVSLLGVEQQGVLHDCGDGLTSFSSSCPPPTANTINNGNNHSHINHHNINHNHNGSTNRANSSSPSPTRNNIQLEISTEDGGSMNISREVTLTNVCLGSATSNSDGNSNSNSNSSNEEGDEEEQNEEEQNEEEEQNNTSFETTSVITNSMSVITDVIDNYSGGPFVSWGGKHGHDDDHGGGIDHTDVGHGGNVVGEGGLGENATEGEGGNMPEVTMKMSSMDIHHHSNTTTTTSTLQDAGNAVYDAFTSFLSGGGGSDATAVAKDAANESSGNENTSDGRRRARSSSGGGGHLRRSSLMVDMLTGDLLDFNDSDDDDNESRADYDHESRAATNDIILLDPPSIASVSMNSGAIIPSSVNVGKGVEGNHILIKKTKSEFKEEEYHPLKKGGGMKNQVGHQVEGEQGGRHQKEGDQGTSNNDDDEEQQGNDEVRNSNSDEYYYQNAHSHENHHHYHQDDHGSGGDVIPSTNDDDVREDSLVLDTLSSDWLPPSTGGPSLEEEEDGESGEGVVGGGSSTLSGTRNNLLGTSMKSLMDGSSSSTDSSGGGGRVVFSNDDNLVQQEVEGVQPFLSAGGEFMDVPYRQHRRKPPQPQRGGVRDQMSGEGNIPAGNATSNSSQDPLQRVPSSSSSSSSSAQRRSAVGGNNKLDGSGRSSSSGSSNPHHHDYYSLSKKEQDEREEESSLNSDMMELHRGLPMTSPMAGDSSRTSDMMELQRGLPMLSPMAGAIPMELQRGFPMLSPMANIDDSMNSRIPSLQRGSPMLSPMAGDASRNSSMLELQRGFPMSPGRRRSIDDSMNSRMMKLQPGAPMEGNEESTTMSDMMELQHGLPMSPDRSESPEEDEYHNANHQDIVHSPIRRREEAIHTMAEALSLHHQYQPTPQSIVIDTKKPEIPDSYPSLMDALQSGSSFGSATTATQSFGIRMPNQSLHDNNEREYIDHEAEEILNVQDDDDEEDRRENSLTYTEFYSTEQPLQGADQVLQAASLPSSSLSPLPSVGGNADPRMNIDYQRHYIVDLQPINEEGTNASRSGVTSGGNPPREGADGVNNNAAENLHQMRQQQQQQLQPPAAAAPNLRQQQQYHPMAPAPHQPNNQFFNYRHQYYQEKYHDDNETAQTSKYDDDTDSTCSSVTLSQAFQGSDIDSCESSVELNSTVSSITFSHVDQHEHDQGFFIATKLGDFVHVPNEVDISEQHYDGDTLPADADANLKTAEEEKFPINQTTSTTDTTTADNTDEVSNATAAPETSKDDAQKQVGATSEDMASDLIASIVPECGVPIPSVMAKVGTRRRKSSNTGFLVPWHSSRSIQNYHFGNQRKKGGRQQRSSSNSSLFSIGSVHTFRG